MSDVAVIHERISEQLAAPLPDGVIKWRQDGRPFKQNGKFWARFVPFIPASVVADRLNDAALGRWLLDLVALQSLDLFDADGQGIVVGRLCAMKARLIISGVAREDIGQGKDYKTAATDAFKRAGMRFGIGRELLAMKGNVIQMDGEGQYAKPLEEPEVAWQRRIRGAPLTPVPDRAAAAAPDANPPCPKCGGSDMYDNRTSKRNPKAPDYKCSKSGCSGAIWPAKEPSTPRAKA